MQSEKIELLSSALANVQKDLSPAEKTGSNSAFGAPRKYLTLTDVWEAIRPLLSANKLSIAQGVDSGDSAEQPILWTLLMHESGQWIRSEMPMLLAKKDPQGVGAAMTYYRRYSLAAMVGVTQDDDDAQSAMPAKGQAQQQQQRPAPAPAAGAKPAPSAGGPADLMDLYQTHQKAIASAADALALRNAWDAVYKSGLSKESISRLQVIKDKRKAELGLTPTPAAA
jgi:hypothetical protein